MTGDLERMLRPEAVAVVGASRDPEKRGHSAIAALQDRGYDGEIFPVNPTTEGSIRGLEVFPDIASIGEPVDLAFVTTPAAVVPDVIADCGAAGVAGAVVVAAGFGEAGNESLSEELQTTARTHGVRVIGPNVNGLINTHDGLNFLDIDVPPGRVALLVQSGNVAVELINRAVIRDSPGISYYLPVGNEADIQIQEYLRFLDADSRTDSIAAFVEGMADGRAVLEAAAAVTMETPIALVKGGRSEAAETNAATHTASLVGNAGVVDDVLGYHGVTVVDRLDDLLPIAETLATQPVADGHGLGILTDGGGDATLAADAAADAGLHVPALESDTQTALTERFPDAPNVRNPVDILTAEHDLSRLPDGAELLLNDSGVDALLVTGIIGGHGVRFSEEQGEAEVAVVEEIAALGRALDAPIVVQSKYADFDSASVDALRSSGIPVCRSIATAAYCLAAAADLGAHRRTASEKSQLAISDDSKRPMSSGNEDRTTRLSDAAAFERLADAGVPVVPWELVRSSEEAASAAASFEDPVAMKIAGPEIAHKSELGGVVLDVEPTDGADAYETLLDRVGDRRPDVPIDGALVTPMVANGVELIVGATIDREVGPVVTLGIGGIFVEAIGEFVARPVPLTRADARSMLEDLEDGGLLAGTRGQPGVATDSLVDMLLTVSEFLLAEPSVTDLDLNPVIGTESTVVAVDADLRVVDDGCEE